ncbi:MAG: hypothetical protein ACI9MC_000618 [Kiritimatiellia bacterium]|jgi:hypothetical protein
MVMKDYVVSLPKVQDAMDLRCFERLAVRLSDNCVVDWLIANELDLADARQNLEGWWHGDEILLPQKMACFQRCEGVMLAVTPPADLWQMTPRVRFIHHRWRSRYDMRHVLLDTTAHERLLLHVFQRGQRVTRMSLALLFPALTLGALERSGVVRVVWRLSAA